MLNFCLHFRLSDPFKRKRTSKLPIPTSTSRRLRQEDAAAALISNAAAAAAPPSTVIQSGQVSSASEHLIFCTASNTISVTM